MSEVVPGILELELDEVVTAPRPGTPDNLPALGEADGVLWATGHHRNGILLTPVTADLVAGMLDGEPLPGWAAACDVGRFAEVPACG
jgi:glycine oxidase